jgi:hypothetical protein
MRAEHARREAQLKAENQTAQALTQTLRNEIIALKDRLNKRGKRKQRVSSSPSRPFQSLHCTYVLTNLRRGRKCSRNAFIAETTLTMR